MDVYKQAHWKHNGCCTGDCFCAFGKLSCVHFAPKPAMMLHFYIGAIFKIAKVQGREKTWNHSNSYSASTQQSKQHKVLYELLEYFSPTCGSS